MKWTAVLNTAGANPSLLKGASGSSWKAVLVRSFRFSAALRHALANHPLVLMSDRAQRPLPRYPRPEDPNGLKPLLAWQSSAIPHQPEMPPSQAEIYGVLDYILRFDSRGIGGHNTNFINKELIDTWTWFGFRAIAKNQYYVPGFPHAVNTLLPLPDPMTPTPYFAEDCRLFWLSRTYIFQPWMVRNLG